MTTNAPPTLEKERLQELLQTNLDARRYFFHKADERWLEWLWRNGFLDVLKEEGASLDGFRTPEIEYLLRMAEKRPDIVVDIMLGTPISTDSRSQEVVYGFLRICGVLPGGQLARVVEKIRDERWVPIMEGFHHLDLLYEEMVGTLADSKDFKSFLLLAEAVLAVRPRGEVGNAPRYGESPFCLESLSRTKLFEQLAGVAPEFAERALALTTSKLAEITASSEQFLLVEVDFFTLEPGQTDRWQDDVRELAAAAKTLAVRLIGERCAESDDVRRIYKELLASLPESRVTRRYRLFVLSLCPEVFKDELTSAFFQLFEVEHYREIASGAEYEKALQTGFPVLSEDEKQDFVQRAISKFSQLPEGVRYKGSQILSMTLPYLDENPALKRQVEEAGYQLYPHYEPGPDVNLGAGGEGGYISPRGPIQKEEFGRLSVVEIAGRLRQEWTPAELNARNSAADLDSPLNAQGMGDLLKEDIPERLCEYVESAGLFLERGVLDQHYTYAFLMGIQETIKNDRAAASEVDWDGVFDLFTTVTNAGESDRFERGQREPDGLYASSWLANWDAVHSAIADVLRELLTEQDGLTPVDFDMHRDRILEITGYLLSYLDPSPADEQIETAPSLIGSSSDANYSVIDPFTMALGSVRGRAYQAFVQFVFQDGRKFNEDNEVKISDDVKGLYESVLQKENTRAIMFLYGHYLPSFYFRDRDWIRKLLPRIFDQEPAQKHLYTAAWEGYLANNLYKEMFLEPVFRNLYQRALDLKKNDFPRQQRHFKEPDKGIATHLALAFMHFSGFGLDHALLNAFWEKDSPKQHAHFVSFIGRSFISRDKAGRSFELSQEMISRLRELWDWLLQKHEKQEVYMEFSLWINLDQGIFEPAWLAQRVRQTLERTNGTLNWGVELVKVCPRLALAAPEDTLEIARFYLLEGGVRGKNQRVLWLWDSDNKWFKAFENLYRNPSTKVETEALINRLVVEGGRAFWPLKRLLAESP